MQTWIAKNRQHIYDKTWYLVHFQNKRGNGQYHRESEIRWNTVGEEEVSIEEKLHRSNSCDIIINRNEGEIMLS